jgi:hypothetical protein
MSLETRGNQFTLATAVIGHWLSLVKQSLADLNFYTTTPSSTIIASA